MMDLTLIQWPDPRLSLIANPLDLNTADVKEVSEATSRMIQIMLDNPNGVGLAAPQVGWMSRVFVMRIGADDHSRYQVFINPEIIYLHGPMETDLEGCLSAKAAPPALIPRNYGITLGWKSVSGDSFLEEQGRFNGLNARIIQHEIDHLDGKMYWNRLSAPERKSLLKSAYPKAPLRGKPKADTLARRKANKGRKRK